MVYYEKIFQDLGIDTNDPGAKITSTLVDTIYAEMDTMYMECKKSLDDAWTLVQKCMNPTIRYIRLMSYYKFMTTMCKSKHEYFGYFSDTLRTCAQLKSANRGTNYWDSPLDNAAINFMHGHYNILYAETRKADVEHMAQAITGNPPADPNPPASESVITDCSPIAPYIGVIRTPFSDIVKDLKKEEEENPETDQPATEGEGPAIDEERIKQLALRHFIAIFNDPEKFEAILNFPEEIKSMYMDHAKYFVREMFHIYPKAVTEFITYSSMISCPDMFPKCAKFMYMDQHCHEQFEKAPAKPVDIKTALEAYEALAQDVHYTEQELTDDTNRILAQAKHVLNKASDKPKPDQDVAHDNVIVPNDQMHAFNLNHLMNFIYTQRRYITDTYTTSSFLAQVAVKAISYIKNFIVIEPDLGTKASEYIYVPVIDTLNGRKACVIRYHRVTEDIDVLTVAEYEESVRMTTGPEPPEVQPDPNETDNDGEYTNPAAGT